MKVAKITAKLRDAVPVCFMVDGEEAAQYKNIELPESIKELDMQGFSFSVSMDGKITFHIMLEAGVLPEALPAPKPLNHRKPKAEATATPEEAAPVAAESTEPAPEAKPRKRKPKAPAATIAPVA